LCADPVCHCNRLVRRALRLGLQIALASNQLIDDAMQCMVGASDIQWQEKTCR
jgi:hypothetical protein